MSKTLLLKCPFCHNNMKYKSMVSQEITAKKKRCVYCGRTFKIHTNPEKSTIIKIY